MRLLITTIADEKFAISNRFFSYVMEVTPEGLLAHLYYGAPLGNPLRARPLHRRIERGAATDFEGIANLNLNELPQEYPGFGRSDYRYPALNARSSGGHGAFALRYKSHRIRDEKPVLAGLPSARGGNSQTLVLTLADAVSGLEVDLFYTVYEDHGVLARSAAVRNIGEDVISLQHILSSALDLPAGEYHLLHLHGTWAQEFNASRTPLPHGRFEISSARGTSSAAHNPFMAIMDKEATETSGRVFAAALIYSGNFVISAETGEFGGVRLMAGLNPLDFKWELGPGEEFFTPEALHVFSANGLSEMSHIWHNFIRDKISPPRFKSAPRPTYLNTWEAAYFDVNEPKVLALADKASDIGTQMLVLDDGWFDGRADDTSSLGDWTADTGKFPDGISGLAAKVKAKGLKFGIWIEPEMVSPNSHLYRQHPDWALQVPGVQSSLGRKQLTLDFSRGEVTDHIFAQIDTLLSSGNIDYVKWDMNRNMSEAGSLAWPASQQGEIAHRYMLGLYALLDRLTKKYPDVLFENCASGGNRFDLGMLHYMAQGWISDMCGPIGRLEIINGASYLYPLDVMAAYIGPSPNHQNGRHTSTKTRFDAGLLCAARGVSLSADDIEAEAAALRQYMQMASETAPDMLGGQFYRLLKSRNDVAWQYISADARTIYLVYFRILAAPNLPFCHVRLAGLEPNVTYDLEGGEPYFGDALMQGGFALPNMEKGDFASSVFIFRKDGT